MKKNLNRISHTLYSSPWLVMPSFHARMVKDFEAYLAGNLKVDMMPDDDNEPESPVEDAPEIVNGIQVICIDGPVGTHLGLMDACYGATDLLCVAQELRTAAANPAVTSIILYINSPGGTVMGTETFANLVAEVDAIKPVVAYVESGLCASAAYWIASQCRSIFTTIDSQIGSVGVYQYMEDWTKAYADAGIKPNCIVSEASPFKVSGASFKELTDTERALFQKEVNDTYNTFTAAILKKRNIDKSMLNGQVFDGRTAIDNGYADAIADSLEDLTKYISSYSSPVSSIITL